MAVVYAAVILLVTLSPGETDPRYWLSGCLICGAVGTADALKNVVFFIPLGVFLALGIRRAWWAAVPAVLLSILVEGLQFFVPGRDASPGDLLFNSLGALIGVVLVRGSRVWLTPGRPSPLLTIAWAAVLIGLVAATGWMQGPSVPVGTYSQQWTPQPAGLRPYAGAVVAAQVGSHDFVDDDLEPDRELDPALLAVTLQEGAPFLIRMVIGPHQPHEAAILRAQDRDKSRIFQIGARGWDLLVGVRTRTSDLRLFEHDQVIPGALSQTHPGDTVEILVERVGDLYCGRVDGTAVGCGRAATVGQWWRWLEPRLERLGGRRLWDALTMLLLLLPLGWWGRGWGAGPVAVGCVVSALLVAPWLTLLGHSPWWEWSGAVLGLMLGAALHGLRPSRTPSTLDLQHR